MLAPIILAGGSGTRLWPLSRSTYPKQLLPLIGEKTLLQETLARLAPLTMNQQAPLIIGNQEHRFLIAEQLRKENIENPQIILEPAGRNTAPAAALAALQLEKDDPILLVLPADHLIQNTERFSAAVQCAYEAAEKGQLVTFGVVPNRAETGYGYIKPAQKPTDLAAYTVERFIEKPPQEKADEFLASGDYLWNSGIFVFKCSTYLAALQKYAPTIFEACQHSHARLQQDLDFLRLDESFLECPSDSIDYAVMEKSDNTVVVPLDAAWSDLGAWDAVYQSQDCDSEGNVCRGDVLTIDTKNTFLHAEHRLVATVGVEDHMIIETPDALLVAHKDHCQKIKPLVQKLIQEGRTEATVHHKVYRPWGCYETTTAGERYQVKRITVNPGAQLSLQLHYHRAEHWIVVRGTARVTRDEETFIVSENESTYIPLGTKHRLENIGKMPLELIEVQTGTYLGEDDIVRFEDTYGRVDGANSKKEVSSR